MRRDRALPAADFASPALLVLLALFERSLPGFLSLSREGAVNSELLFTRVKFREREQLLTIIAFGAISSGLLHKLGCSLRSPDCSLVSTYMAVKDSSYAYRKVE